MNENSAMRELLHKFILNQCTPHEMEQVIAYCKDNALTSDFPTVEEVKWLRYEMDTPQMSETTADTIFSNIIAKSKETETISIAPKKHYKRYIAIAASIAVLLTVGLSYRQGFFNMRQPLVLTGNEITLQLANGDIQVISEGKKTQVIDAEGNIIGTQNGNTIAYNTQNTLEALAYNTIKIPYGKRFELQLSDGTTVHLNSGTTLKYPVKFIASENRKVFLDGEAFFDVAKDKTHPFVVNANELNVRVLGTHFNVTNYSEDDLTDVVLVEGSVGLYTQQEQFDANKSTILKPGYKASFNKSISSINTKKVDPEVYTSWMKGNLTFKNMTFKNIAKKLERHYDVSIVIQNNKLAEEKFSASFKDQSIVKVLSYFNEIQGFHYKIEDKNILIK